MSKLTKCQSCGDEISKTAKACPKCGAVRKRGKLKLIILLLIGAVIIRAASMGGGTQPLRLLKAYIINSNIQTQVFEFESTADKPIEAFEGHLVTFDKLGNRTNKILIECQKSIPLKHFFLVRNLFDSATEEHIMSEAELRSSVVVQDVDLLSMEIKDKYEFRVRKVVLAE